MKIAVCIKQVPTREWQPRLNDDKTWIREQDVSYEMNEPDAYALEEALRLREKHGGEVVVCSAGPARVQQVIREALARGADRALHVEDDSLGAADAFTAAAALAPAMAEQKFDLILTGLQSDDQGHAQFGPVLAEKLGIPHSTIIMEVNVDGSALRVKRELEGGWFQYVSMPLPALLTIQSGINQLRYATLKGIMAAKKKEITKVAAPPAGCAARQKIVGAVRAAEVQADRDDRRLARRSGEGAGQAASRRGEGPVILVVAEQKDGKLNRASWETIAAAQQLSGGAMPIKVAVAGQGVSAWRSELAAGGRRRGDRRRSRGAGALHARRLRAGAAAGDRAGRAGDGVVPAHLSDARFLADAGDAARSRARSPT